MVVFVLRNMGNPDAPQGSIVDGTSWVNLDLLVGMGYVRPANAAELAEYTAKQAVIEVAPPTPLEEPPPAPEAPVAVIDAAESEPVPAPEPESPSVPRRTRTKPAEPAEPADPTE